MTAGASFFYQTDSVPYQQQEVRAYGLLLKDLVARLETENQAADCAQQHTILCDIVEQCVIDPDVLQRPTFQQLVRTLCDIELE